MFAKTLTAAAVLMLATPFAMAEELKLADFQPPTHFVVDNVYTPFAEAVAAGTNNDVTVKLYMGGELEPGPADQYSRVVDGLADIAFGLPGYTASTFPKTLLTELPGVIDAQTGTANHLRQTVPRHRQTRPSQRRQQHQHDDAGQWPQMQQRHPRKRQAGHVQ